MPNAFRWNVSVPFENGDGFVDAPDSSDSKAVLRQVYAPPCLVLVFDAQNIIVNEFYRVGISNSNSNSVSNGKAKSYSSSINSNSNSNHNSDSIVQK